MAEYEVKQFNLYNKETIYTNCTVQIWENTYTGEISIGWYPNEGCEKIENNP